MKVPKRIVRSADGTKTLERPYKLAVDANGEPLRVYSDARGYTLPSGARWATDADAHHEEVAEGMAHRAWNASKR